MHTHMPLIRRLPIHVYIRLQLFIDHSLAELLLGVAVEVVAVSDAEHVAVALVVADAVDVGGVGSHAALQPAVDDVGDHAVPGYPPRGGVRGRRRPVAEDDVVARRLGRLRRHPETERRLERDNRVRRHLVRSGLLTRSTPSALPASW
jgi:hypothetical protein